jgi:triphosphatase
MEFSARVESIDQLLRNKQLTVHRDGRARTAPAKILWHDSPDKALQHIGRSLSEQRGTWRLEALRPTDATWLPGQPAGILAEAASLAELGDLPAPLAPIAAFEGKRTVTLFDLGSGPVTLTCLRGVLRSVTATHPAARLWIEGEPHAVHAAALLIDGIAPITVPTATLAAEAIALAGGGTPQPRRTGAPKLPSGDALAIDDALRHILGHLLDVILYLAPAAVRRDVSPAAQRDSSPAAQRDSSSVEAVHQMRVAVRRARSAMKLFASALPPDALQSVTAGLRTIGANLGPCRDWDVFVGETLPSIRGALPPDERLDRLLVAAERRCQEARKALTIYLNSAEFRTLTIELACAIASFGTTQQPTRTDRPSAAPSAVAPEMASPESTSLEMATLVAIDGSAVTLVPPPSTEAAPRAHPPSDLTAFAGVVIGRRYRKLVSSGKSMQEMDIPGLHGVRLRAKQVRYSAEMFVSLHPGRPAQRFIRRLSALQERLGTLNDGAVASHLMDQLGGAGGRHAYAVGVVTGFLAARTAKIRPRIIRAFRKFKHQSPYWT